MRNFPVLAVVPKSGFSRENLVNLWNGSPEGYVVHVKWVRAKTRAAAIAATYGSKGEPALEKCLVGDAR